MIMLEKLFLTRQITEVEIIKLLMILLQVKVYVHTVVVEEEEITTMEIIITYMVAMGDLDASIAKIELLYRLNTWLEDMN